MRLLGQFYTFLSFFYEKILHAPKALKALKALKDTKTQPSKAQNPNKRISDHFPLDVFMSLFYYCTLISVLCILCL